MHVICFRCGASNPPNENYCLKCGATLPKMAYSMEMVDVKQVDERYQEFVSAVNALKSGEMSADDFAEFAESTLDKLQELEEEIDELIDDLKKDRIKPGMWEEFREEMETGKNGMVIFMEGVNTLLDYLDDKKPRYLSDGLDKIRHGNALINRAKELNRSRDRKFGPIVDVYRDINSIEM